MLDYSTPKETPYKLSIEMKSPWLVGFSPYRNEMFLYRIDQDDLVWIFRKTGLDLVAFDEYVNFNKLGTILLGEL